MQRADMYHYKSRLSSFLTALVLLAVFAAGIFLSIEADKPPRPKGASAPDQVFSAIRAADHLTWIAAKPHPVGSVAHEEVKKRLVETFRQTGLETQTQKALVPRNEESLIRVENIIAKLKGTGGTGAVMLASHYDSVPGSYGAADDGAGVAATLEIARILKSGLPLKHDVIFLISDGEELGCSGAQAFVTEHPWAAQVKQVINLEARGTDGPAWIYETSVGNAPLVKALAKSSPHVMGNSSTDEIYKLLPHVSDLTIFKHAGIQGLGIAFMNQAWHYHHPNDSLGNLSRASLQQMGDVALGMARLMASGNVPTDNSENAVFFTLFGRYFIHYSEGVVQWLSAISATLALLLLFLGFRAKQLHMSQLIKVFAIFPITLITAGAFGLGLEKGLTALHGLWGVNNPLSLVYNPYYVLSLLGVTLITTWLLLKAMEQVADITNLQVGGMVIWTFLACTVSLRYPALSYLLHWPVLAALLGALFTSGWIRAQLPAAFVIIILYGPTIAFLNTALGWNMYTAIVIPILTTLLAWQLLPILSRMEEGYILGSSAIILLLSGIGMGRLWSIETFQWHTFSSLQYHLNIDNKTAFWVADTGNKPAFMNLARPGEPSWKGADQPLRGTITSRVHQGAEILKTQQPCISLISNTFNENGRVLKLSVDPQGAKDICILGEDRGFLSGSIAGLTLHSMEQEGKDTLIQRNKGGKEWEMALYGAGPEPLEVELVYTPTKEPIKIVLVAIYEGLPDWPERNQVMPSHIKPVSDGNSTLVSRVLNVPLATSRDRGF